MDTKPAIQEDYADPYAYRSLSDTQKVVLAVLPIPAAILSIIGSSVIIYMARVSRGTKPWTPYNRLLVAMSVWDVIASIALASATFLNPKETSTKALAMGNDSTCSFMGFLNQISYSGTLYNASLSFYFLLSARFGMKNDKIANQIEPAMHIFSVGFPMLTAFAGLFIGVYSESETNLGCWVSRYPKRCAYGPDGTGEPCLSPLIGWIFGGSIGLFTLFALVINNFVIWFYVRGQIKKAMMGRDPLTQMSTQTTIDIDEDKCLPQGGYSQNSSTISTMNPDTRAAQRKRLRLVSSQAFFFVASYFVSNIASYVLKLLEGQATSYVQEKELPLNHFILMILQNFLLPLQGIFNMMVYIRPKYLKLKGEYPRESWAWVLKRAVCGSKVEPTHSLLGIVKAGSHPHKGIVGNKNRNTLGKDMISSLTNVSDINTEEDENGNVAPNHCCLHRNKTARSRGSRYTRSSLDVISEVPEPEDLGSIQAKRNVATARSRSDNNNGDPKYTEGNE